MRPTHVGAKRFMIPLILRGVGTGSRSPDSGRKGRALMAMTDEEIEGLLRKDGVCTLTLNGKDGYPVPVPLGFAYEGGKIYVMATPYRKKLVARDPRVTVNVFGDTLADARWVSIRGRATVTREKARERVRELHLHSGLSIAETDRWMELIRDPAPELLEITPESHTSWKMRAPDFVRRAPVSTWFS